MWLSLSIVALSLVARGSAQDCGFTYSLEIHEISTQEELDTLADACPTLHSDISVLSNFTGPFVLKGMIGANGITMGGDGASRPLDIPSIEFPNLEHVESLFLQYLSNLETFEVPKLASTYSVLLDIDAVFENLEFPALEETAFLTLKGNLTDITFDALQNVTYDLIISNRRSGIAETSMDISFPVLNSSETIYIDGKASSISLPELTTLTNFQQRLPDSFGSNFTLWGEEISPEFPKLETIDGSIIFEGNITGLSLPSLRDVEGNFTVKTGNTVSLDLPLATAGVVEIIGMIESLALPNLYAFDAVHVSSDLPLECAEILALQDDPIAQNRGAVVTCVGREAAEEDTEEEDTEDAESGENGESAAGSEESTTNGDEAGNAESGTGTGTGSAALNAGRDTGFIVAASLSVVGLAGLAF